MSSSKFGQKAQQQGQIGVIILLIMSVLLTLGLSLARRSSQEAEITSQEEESTRVFNAAESGIEEALSDIYESERQQSDLGGSATGSLGSGADQSDYQANITAQNSVEMTIPKNSTIDVPLNTPAGSIDIDWWNNRGTDCTADNPAALMVVAYDDDTSTNTTVARYFYLGACNAAGEATPYFDEPNINTGSGYQFSADESFITLNPAADRTTTRLRITPLVSDTQIRIEGDVASDTQYSVTSSGQDIDATTARTITVNRSRSAAPAFMNYALVAGGSGIQKN